MDYRSEFHDQKNTNIYAGTWIIVRNFIIIKTRTIFWKIWKCSCFWEWAENGNIDNLDTKPTHNSILCIGLRLDFHCASHPPPAYHFLTPRWSKPFANHQKSQINKEWSAKVKIIKNWEIWINLSIIRKDAGLNWLHSKKCPAGAHQRMFRSGCRITRRCIFVR